MAGHEPGRSEGIFCGGFARGPKSRGRGESSLVVTRRRERPPAAREPKFKWDRPLVRAVSAKRERQRQGHEQRPTGHERRVAIRALAHRGSANDAFPQAASEWPDEQGRAVGPEQGHA